MRLLLKFKVEQGVSLPLNNQHILNGYIHKVLGENNNYHDRPSEYNISGIIGGKMNQDDKRLYFDEGFKMVVSGLDDEFISSFMIKCMKNKEMFKGINYYGADLLNEQLYNEYNYFQTLSPIILKKDNRLITIKDNDFQEVFEAYLKRVAYKTLKREVDIKITINKDKQKTKLIKVKGISNPCSHFSFKMECDIETTKLFYYNGIGLSRGSGFGCISTTKQNSIYYQD